MTLSSDQQHLCVHFCVSGWSRIISPRRPSDWLKWGQRSPGSGLVGEALPTWVSVFQPLESSWRSGGLQIRTSSCWSSKINQVKKTMIILILAQDPLIKTSWFSSQVASWLERIFMGASGLFCRRWWTVWTVTWSAGSKLASSLLIPQIPPSTSNQLWRCSWFSCVLQTFSWTCHFMNPVKEAVRPEDGHDCCRTGPWWFRPWWFQKLVVPTMVVLTMVVPTMVGLTMVVLTMVVLTMVVPTMVVPAMVGGSDHGWWFLVVLTMVVLTMVVQTMVGGSWWFLTWPWSSAEVKMVYVMLDPETCIFPVIRNLNRESTSATWHRQSLSMAVCQQINLLTNKHSLNQIRSD